MTRIGPWMGQGLFIAAVALQLVAGCSSSRQATDAGEDAGGEDADGADVGPGTEGGAGERCGPVRCPEGKECCNASCGTCVEPGLSCPAIACVDGGMTTTACGGRLGDTCSEDEYCEFSAGGCGFDDGTGRCMPRPSGCPEHCPRVCGCDGMTHCNDCLAASAGTDVLHEGPCESDSCGVMDAAGEGACRELLGWKWDGEACVAVSGCECVGTDCDALHDGEAGCREAHADCTP